MFLHLKHKKCVEPVFSINAYPVKNCLSDLIGGLLGEELMPVEV
jgi:hypothetical protein